MQAPPGTAASGFGESVPIPPPALPILAQLPAPLSLAPRRILIVEDDAPLARLLATGFAAESLAADLVHDAESVEHALKAGNHALVLLDLNLPKMDGLTLLHQLRATHPRLPVLVLTGRSRTEDIVKALDQGADGYLLKPFSLLELMARVRVLLRRDDGPLPIAGKAAGLVLDRAEFCVHRNGRLIHLTPREFTVLDFLLLHEGKPISRATLMQEVWSMPLESNTNIVDVYMKYLRDKIDAEGEPKLIHTVRGVGYVLRAG